MTTTNEEWGPWIAHDGSGCPVAGMFTRDMLADGTTEDGIVDPSCASPPPDYCSLWIWASIPDYKFHRRVIRYRIRKPKGTAILQSLLENLPVTREMETV